MSSSLRIILVLLVAATDLYSLHQIRKGKMSLNHSLLWILVSLILLALAIFPGIAYWISSVMGIGLPINMVFLSFSLFSIILFIYLTNVVSKEDRINRRLTQQVALLEERIRELEGGLKKGTGNKEAEKEETGKNGNDRNRG